MESPANKLAPRQRTDKETRQTGHNKQRAENKADSGGGKVEGAGERSSAAWGVSGEGAIVVGQRSDGATNTGFRWTEAGGFSGIGTLGGDTLAYGISSDGSTIVGDSQNGNADSRAFRWTQAGGIQSLGTLNGGGSAEARAANADGSVIVGYANDGANGNISRAFRWTQATGMITVEQWLRNYGVSIPKDVTSAAYGVSADGNVVVGAGAPQLRLYRSCPGEGSWRYNQGGPDGCR